MQELRENKEVAEKRNGDLKAQCEKLEQVTALKVNDAQADQDTKTQLADLQVCRDSVAFGVVACRKHGMAGNVELTRVVAQIELVKTNDRLYEKEETVKDLEKRLGDAFVLALDAATALE